MIDWVMAGVLVTVGIAAVGFFLKLINCLQKLHTEMAVVKTICQSNVSRIELVYQYLLNGKKSLKK